MVLAAAAIIGFQIFVPPVTGLANNGDFAKLIGPFAMSADPADEYHYAATRYRFDEKHRFDTGTRSSAILPAAIAIGLGRLVSRDGTFDLRWIGAVHLVLLLGAIWLWMAAVEEWPLGQRLVLACVVLGVACDAFYATKLNSFYVDAGTLVFLALASAFAIHWLQTGSERFAWAFTVFAALAVSTKEQHCLLAIPFIGLLLWRRRGLPRVGLMASVLILSAGFAWRAKTNDHANNAFYTIVFYRLLPLSSDPDGDLATLGLDGSYKRFIGKSPFDPDSGMADRAFQRELTAKRSFARLALLYLKRPGHIVRAIRSSADEAGRIRPALGNYDRGTGHPPGAESHAFAAWSSLKKAVFHNHGALYVVYFATLVAGLIALAYDGRWFAPVVTLCISALLELLVTGGAEALETTRHMYIFNVLVDGIGLAVVGVALGRFGRWDRWV